MNAPTPAPWKWIKRSYPNSKTWELIHPQDGYLVVMDFVRLGMQSGTFRLASWIAGERGNMGGIMRPAHELDLENHPDARLIATSPLMIAALEAVKAFGSGGTTDDGISVSYLVEEAIKEARVSQ